MSTSRRKPYAVRRDQACVRATARRHAPRRFVSSVSSGAVHTEQRRTTGDELADRRYQLEHNSPAARAVSTRSSWSRPVTTPDDGDRTTAPSTTPGAGSSPRSGYTRSSSRRVPSPTSSISADTRSAWPMWCTYDDEHDDAREHEGIGDNIGETGHGFVGCAVDLAQREQRVRECRDEHTDRDLARLLAEDRLHDAGRELAHGELHDNHRDRQDEHGQRHHRQRDRSEDLECRGRPTRQRMRNQLVVVRPVDRDGERREHEPDEDAHDRHEPERRSGAAGAAS